MNFHQEFRSNVGGISRASIDVPGSYGFTPVRTTVKARADGSSGVFTVQPEISGKVSPQESRIVVPPQILLQMMRNEARGLSSTTVQVYLGWVFRNRFGDTQFNQNTYQAGITADATHDTGLTTGEQPELNNAANVFDGFADPTRGCQGFWSPTVSQWTTVQTLFGTTEMPDRSATGIPFFYGGDRTRTQIVYFSSVGNSNTQNAPAFLFLRRRNPGDKAAVQLN